MSEEDMKNGDTEKTPEERIEEARRLAVEEAEAKAKEVHDAMIAELQAERQKRQAAEEELEKGKHQEPPKDTDPEYLVEQVLKKKEQESSKRAFEEAKAEIRNTYNEFSEETDKAGIVFSKFEKELSKFNLSGLTTKEEYINRLKEVYEFMNRDKKPGQESSSFYTGQKPDGSDVKAGDGVTLSNAETSLIKDMGWTKDRYLKVKEKRPSYVASLLKYRG